MNLFLLQLWFELTKLFARKRTYVGFIAFVAAEGLIFHLLHLAQVKKSLAILMQRSGYLFTDLYTGPTLAFLMLYYTVVLLGRALSGARGRRFDRQGGGGRDAADDSLPARGSEPPAWPQISRVHRLHVHPVLLHRGQLGDHGASCSRGRDRFSFTRRSKVSSACCRSRKGCSVSPAPPSPWDSGC